MNKSIKIISTLVIIVLAAATIWIFRTNNTSALSRDAHLTILKAWGPCITEGACHEEVTTYDQELVQKAFDIYKSNTCTRVYGTDRSESYQITDGDKVYAFAKDSGGCKEMEDVVKAAK
jgi:hypothetical protein